MSHNSRSPINIATADLLRSLPELETVYIESSNTPPLCVHRHRPVDRPRAGLLICRPLLAESDANEPREVWLARRCVAQGVAVNRFSYRGTGDSFGDFARASFADLVVDAELALADLHREVSGGPIAVMGSRLGALVAASLAQRHDLDLVLWDPVTVPELHVKELVRTQMVHLMNLKRSGHTASALRAALDAGEVIDVSGWDLPGGVLQSLNDELGAAIPQLGESDRTVFVLTTQNHGSDLTRLVPADVDIERTEMVNREPIWLPNFDLANAEASLALVEHTDEWIETRLVPSRRVAQLDLDPPETATFDTGARETPFFLDTGDAQLAAYLTEPGGRSNGQGLVIMSGANRGTGAGPNRLWARLARQLADDGYSVLRFSYRATSNSTGDNAVFDLAAPLVADGRAAVEAMRSTGVDEVSLLGWCYGCVLATAVADADIRRVMMLSPSLRTNTLGIRSYSYQIGENLPAAVMIRNALKPSKWRALGDPRQRRYFTRLVQGKSRLLWRRMRGVAGGVPGPSWLNHGWLDGLERIARASDTDLRIVFGRGDIDYRDYEEIRDGRISEIFAVFGDRLEIHRQDSEMHMMNTPEAQQTVMSLVPSWMAGVGTLESP